MSLTTQILGVVLLVRDTRSGTCDKSGVVITAVLQ